MKNLYFKNDAVCFPTLSFKDRVVATALAAVGVSMNPDVNQIGAALDDRSPSWPQMADQSGLAARYNIDPRAGKTLVLDSSHRIVAAGPMGPEIEKAVRDLLVAP